MNQTMQDKVYRDIENETGPFAQRQAQPFPTFMYDSMIMQYGLQQIAIKVIVQLTNGLKEY
jgi:hypothetical protein